MQVDSDALAHTRASFLNAAECEETAGDSGQQRDTSQAMELPSQREVLEGGRLLRQMAEHFSHWADTCYDVALLGQGGFDKSIRPAMAEMFDAVSMKGLLCLMPPEQLQQLVLFGQQRLGTPDSV